MDGVLQLPGNWKLDDSGKKYPGVLFIDKEKLSVCLKIWFYGENKEDVEPFEADFVRPVVTGLLMNGKHVTLSACVGMLRSLRDNTKIPNHTSEYHVQAKYAFMNVDVTSECELRFRGAIVDYGDIGEWAQESVVDYEFDCNENCEWHLKHKTGTHICIREGAYVFISSAVIGGRKNDMRTEVVIRQPILVQFYYQAEESWDRIMDDVEIVRELIAFGMDRHVELKSVQTVHDSMLPQQMRGSQSFHASYCEEVYIGTKRKDSPFRRASEFVTLSLPDIVPFFKQDSEDGWKRLSLSRSIIKLFLEAHVYTDEINAEKVFLNLARGFEAAHRSCDMISGGNGEYIAFWLRLKAMLEPLCDIDGSGFSKANLRDDIKSIVDSRNYYTHYDPKLYNAAMRDERLVKLNWRLTSILRYYILKLLGLEESIALERTGMGNLQKSKVVEQSISYNCLGDYEI